MKISSPASGASLTGLTVKSSVVRTSFSPSLMLYVKSNSPLKFSVCVIVKEPSSFATIVASGSLVCRLDTVKSSPSTSVAFASNCS